MMNGKITKPDLKTSSNSTRRNRLSLAALKFYKNAISPYLPPACRFTPTCSEYAMTCFQKYSWPKALGLSAKRLARCHPFCAGGYDPVP